MAKAKICGITTEEELDICKGADYLGFIVESSSPKNLTPTRASELMAMSSAKTVLVTTSRDPIALMKLANRLEPDVVQIHSLMSPRDVDFVLKRTPGGVWTRVGVSEPGVSARIRSLRPVSSAVILACLGWKSGPDAQVKEWKTCHSLRDEFHPYPIIISGGLSPDLVSDALELIRPFAVDVCAGVEVDGHKDRELVERFIRTVHQRTND